jgi:hypothetical protein
LAADFFRVGFFLLTVFFLRAGFFLAMLPSLSKTNGQAIMHHKPMTIPSRSHSAKLLLRRPCQA